MNILKNDLYKRVQGYLNNLGYPTSSIVPQYKHQDSTIDLIIKDREKILVVVEMKSPSKLSISKSEISYHPVTRKLQRDAVSLGAKYYLLTNGIEYLWLKTGLTGRPEKINEISYQNFYNSIPLTESEYSQNALWHISEYLRHYMITGDFMFDLSLVLYSQLAKEREVDNVEASMEHLLKDVNSKKNLDEAVSRFSEFNVNLINQPEIVFSFIDDLFKSRAKELVVPRWLCDFMIKLLDQPKDATLIDIFGRNGTMLSSAHHNEYKNIYSYYTNQQDFYWLMIQQLLFSNTYENLIHLSTYNDLYYRDIEKLEPDVVLIAPPFNVKVTDIEFRQDFRFDPIKDMATLFILKSIDAVKPNGCVVAIVPEGFLFSNNKSSTLARKYIKNYVEAVISLPLDTFRPYAAVKTSLLILSKNKKNQEEIFFSNLDSVPEENIFFDQKNNDINEVLFQIKKYREKCSYEKSDNSFVVKSLETNNYQYSNYWYKQSGKNDDNIDSKYQLVPLRDLVIIKAGNDLKRVADGDIPYIVPASLRKLEINRDKFDYTSEKIISNKTLKYTKIGNIVMNNISNFRGSAALVTEEFDNMLVGSKIFILESKSNLINTGYLSIALNTHFVQEQLYKNTSGNVIPALKMQSFDDILIPIINIEEQEKIYREYKNQIEELKELKHKQLKLEQEINSKLRNFGTRKEEQT